MHLVPGSLSAPCIRDSKCNGLVRLWYSLTSCTRGHHERNTDMMFNKSRMKVVRTYSEITADLVNND